MKNIEELITLFGIALPLVLAPVVVPVAVPDGVGGTGLTLMGGGGCFTHPLKFIASQFPPVNSSQNTILALQTWISI